MSDCLFCRMVAGEVPCDKVYEDERVLAFRDIHPRADVHLLLIPNQHIASLDELDASHDALVAYMLRLLPQLAREQGLKDGFRTIINTGPAGGQVVFHLHMHLLGGASLPGFG